MHFSDFIKEREIKIIFPQIRIVLRNPGTYEGRTTMSEQTNNPTPRPKKKRRPRWQRILIHYWPLIRLCLLALLCLTLIIMAIVALVKNIGKDKESPEDASLAATSDPAEQEKPSEDDLVQQAITAAMEVADRMAQGYDYLGAIEKLKTIANWEDNAAVTAKISEYETADAALVPYENMSSITHIYFHSLIVDPERAFDDDANAPTYNMNYTTVTEFKAILESLYQKGFVLVSPYDVATQTVDEQNVSTFSYSEIRLPTGKTPFMMSQDQVNYYGSMIGAADGSNETPVFASADGDGFASKLVLEGGEITCEYMDASGKVTTGDYDLIPILESFIEEHPDFSYHGARAIIAVSGYEGVFGYRTKPSYETALGADEYAAEVEAAKEVAQYLRDNGWDLASMTYGMPNYGSVDSVHVDNDSTKFEETVESIIGETDILIFPNGSDIAGLEMYTGNNYKFAVLYEDGYRYFFNKDNTVAWHQIGANYFRGNRRSLDGYRLYHFPEMLEDLVNAEDILDTARPLPVPGP